jgi:elongation factor Ts
MEITASQVNELRKVTGAGMMDCKKALTEAAGDMTKAVEVLRKKGAAVAAKRAEKTAKEGIVITKVSADKKTAVVVEVNCETDFVAKSDDFIALANAVVDAVFEVKPSSVEELLAKAAGLQEKINDVLAKIGEKIEISRFSVEVAEGGMVVDYIHPGSKLGILVQIDNVADDKKEVLAPVAKDIAMQVAAMKPICVYREEVDKSVIDAEIDIYKEVARKEGKPEAILEKIALGKLNKFYQENCLFEQAYIKDNAKSIGELIKDFNSQNGADVKLKLFRRFSLGEEKK